MYLHKPVVVWDGAVALLSSRNKRQFQCFMNVLDYINHTRWACCMVSWSAAACGVVIVKMPLIVHNKPKD